MQAFQTGKARYRGVFDALGDGLIVWDTDNRVLDCNRSAARILGLSPDAVVGASFADVMAAAGAAVVIHAESGLEPSPLAAERVRSTGRSIMGQVLAIDRPDGTRAWIEVDVSRVRSDGDADGEVIVSSFRDITKRKAAEDRMRALSAIVESASDAILRHSPDGVIESWNGGAERLYGFTAQEVVGTHVSAVVPEDHLFETEQMLLAAIRGTSIDNVLTVRQHRDGHAIQVVVTMSPLFDSSGAVVGISEIAGDVSELVAARDALARSEERFRSLVQRSADVAFVLDAQGVVSYASPAVEHFGFSPEDVVGLPSRSLIHPGDVERSRDLVHETLQRTGTCTVEWRFRTADGSYRWCEEVLTDMREVPAVGGYVANVRDITDRKQAEQDRVEAEERFRQGFERSAFGLAVLDLHHSCTSANPALAELLGYPVEQLLGRRPIEFMHPAETDSARAGVERLLRSDGPRHYKREHRMVRADGSLIWALVDMTLVRDAHEQPSYYFVQVRDIADRKRVEEALEHQALHDDLTRLPNRLLLVDRLSHSLARTDRTDTNLAVLFLDLDRFKHVNDGLGHVVGDQLLVEVAQRLQHAVRGSDTVARFGGDEFVIVREDVHDVSEAFEFAERVAAILHEPIALSGREIYATTSIGIAIGGQGASAEQLLRDADAAMYRAKDLGRARIELFSHELQQRVAARLDLESALRQAIDRDELELLYQPIVRLADGRVVGAEALLRWHREGHGVVLPGDFIPVAEETGLIVPIGTWALEHALTEMRALTRARDTDWPLLAVNLSALQLRLPTSIEMVRNAIKASGVDPSMLSLEITESALMDDIEVSARAMHALRDLGVRLAVDDFGTGYSSLAYLKQLPVDSLKIDRSFIEGLPSDLHARSITEAIITLGNSLGLTIVAEGVETVEQWIALDELGCTVGQGFLWSPPIPAAAFAPLITGLRRTTRVARSAPARAADAN